MSVSDDNPKKPSASKIPFLMRTQAMSSSGWEAYTIGFTLVGCIVAGAGLGWLLDNYFKTSFWLPILFLVGVVAGFREMLVVLKRVSAQQERERQAKQAARPLVTEFSTRENAEDSESKAPSRERIFQVPPPPVPGQKIVETPLSNESQHEDSVEELIEKLLREGDDESPKSREKREPNA